MTRTQTLLLQALNLWFLVYAVATVVQILAASRDAAAAELDGITVVFHLVVLASYVAYLHVRPESRPAFALFFLSCVLSLILADLYFYAQRRAIGGHRIDPHRWDKQFESVKQRRAAGEDAVTFMVPSNYFVGLPPMIDGRSTLPLSGIPKAQTLLCDELGFMAEYRADRYGYANPDEAWNAPGKGLALLGDSFVHGACVKPEDSFAGRLRTAHPKTLNLGVSGAGPLTQLAILREFGALANPDTVLWFYFPGNDLIDLSIESRQPILDRYLREPGFRQNLPARTAQIDDFLRVSMEALLAKHVLGSMTQTSSSDQGRLFTLARGVAKRLIFADIAEIVRSMIETSGRAIPVAMLERIMTAARDETCRMGGKLVLVFLPDTRTLPWGRQADGKKEFLSLMHRLGLSVIDVEAAMLKAPDPRSLVVGHFSPEGNAIIADALIESLDSARRESRCP